MAAMIAMTAGVSACAEAAGRSYVLEPGLASYDALDRATQACKARGGEIARRDGYDDLQRLDSYQCRIGGK
jgi:hypothetical protein